MEKEIKEALDGALKDLELFVDSVNYGVDEETNENTLFIILDSNKEEVIDVESIVSATKIINPIIDKLDLIKEEYTLDVSSKERGNN